MADVNTVLDANRAAVSELIAAAEKSGEGWLVPRAEGKWSPSQVVEHVARALEESANVVAGAPSKFPTLPSFVRPVIRTLFFKRALKNQSFPRGRTNRAFNPANGPATPQDARARLQAAMARFDRECRERASSGQPVTSTIFGEVTLVDYAQFQALHTRHHCRQMPGVV